MIPKTLALQGFLSYRQPVQIDFSNLHLACISGHNGAGKSSILDAITWALFGQARARGESVITLGEAAAEVSFTFAYEHNLYRVIRRLERGKGSALQFQIHRPEAGWHTLSERSLRATQARIHETLRLDYETFINAAFFLQGRADQFTQQTPGARKEILARILGLEVWEAWRQRAVAQRRAVEAERNQLAGSLDEIDRELQEAPQRQQRLAALQNELQLLEQNLHTKREQLAQTRQQAAALQTRRQTLQALKTALEQSQDNLNRRQQRLQALQTRLQEQKHLLSQAEHIEARYRQLQNLQQQKDALALQARQASAYEEQRNQPLQEIAAARARLEQEIASLEKQRQAAEEDTRALQALHQQIEARQAAIDAASQQAAAIEKLRAEVAARHKDYEQRWQETTALKQQTESIQARIDRLQDEEATEHCPTCGRPLSPEQRQQILATLQAEGEALAADFRAQRAALTRLREQIQAQEARIHSWEQKEAPQLEKDRIALGQLKARAEEIQARLDHWQQTLAPRLQALQKTLAEDQFAPQARARLQAIETQLQALGYNPQTYEHLQKQLADLQTAAEEYQQLVAAKASYQQLEEEIASLQGEIAREQQSLQQQNLEYNQLAAQIAAEESALPSLNTLEREALALQSAVNEKMREVGSAEQKVRVLDQLRQRKKTLQRQQASLSQQIARYQQLEKALGKNGAPALIIEQALPQIESHANDLLARLSNGQMSLRFKTQAAYKDKKRKDLKETLEIEISDNAGVRQYEMFSGGEAFRINFAIRLALARVLAQRKGARLQMLVIDEGFGSQDVQGKQRLIEAINAIRDDFATILVITHLEELKDAFPARIEVHKTPGGSTIQIV